MTTPENAQERRLWWLAALYFLAILATAYFVRFAVDFLRARGWLGSSFWILTAAVALAGAWWLTRHRPRPRELAYAAAVAAVYAGAFLAMSRIEERIHLFQYGLLALLLDAALAARARRGGGPSGAWSRALVAGGLTALAGLLDELWQGWLPNRMYDTRDVALNAASGALALLALAGWRWLRRERTGHPAPGRE
jgi:hypothetical protein